MVMFLTGLVTIILMRTLKRDYARYARVGWADLPGLRARVCVCVCLQSSFSFGALNPPPNHKPITTTQTPTCNI